MFFLLVLPAALSMVGLWWYRSARQLFSLGPTLVLCQSPSIITIVSMQYHYIGEVSLPFADQSFWSLTWIWIEKGFEQVLVSDNCEWLMDSRWWRGISEWFPERPLYSGAHRLKRVMQEEMHPRESFPSTRPLMLHAPPPRLCGRGCGAAKVQTYTIVGPHQIHHSALQTGKSIHFPTAVQGTYSQKSILLFPNW